MNKDAAANSPVVTPVPPPANDVNNHTAIKEGEEPMEISATSKLANDVNSKVGAVKTEVLESSRGILLFTVFLSCLVVKRTSRENFMYRPTLKSLSLCYQNLMPDKESLIYS